MLDRFLNVMLHICVQSWHYVNNWEACKLRTWRVRYNQLWKYLYIPRCNVQINETRISFCDVNSIYFLLKTKTQINLWLIWIQSYVQMYRHNKNTQNKREGYSSDIHPTKMYKNIISCLSTSFHHPSFVPSIQENSSYVA